MITNLQKIRMEKYRKGKIPFIKPFLYKAVTYSRFHSIAWQVVWHIECVGYGLLGAAPIMTWLEFKLN